MIEAKRFDHGTISHEVLVLDDKNYPWRAAWHHAPSSALLFGGRQ
jgi:hypothetical protein